VPREVAECSIEQVGAVRRILGARAPDRRDDPHRGTQPVGRRSDAFRVGPAHAGEQPQFGKPVIIDRVKIRQQRVERGEIRPQLAAREVWTSGPVTRTAGSAGSHRAQPAPVR